MDLLQTKIYKQFFTKESFPAHWQTKEITSSDIKREYTTTQLIYKFW